MKTLWRIIVSLIFTSFMCGLILGLFIGSSAHAEMLKQRFALVIIPYNVAQNGFVVYFDSFELCESARRRIEDQSNDLKMACVPTEEKHK